MILFNNKEILIDGNSFLKEWKEKGVISTQDILDNDGKFLAFKSFQDKFNIKCNFLSYLQVISAIPKHLVHKAKSLGRRESPITDRDIDLYKMKCKDNYWLYINGTTCTAKGHKKMGKKTKITEYWLEGKI